MKEQFVTYEIALKLKELGFDEPCFGWYSYEEFNPLRIQKCETYLGIESCTKAPLWQQAIDWFAENYIILIQQQFNGYTIVRKFGKKEFISDTWINAKEQALYQALELIK